MNTELKILEVIQALNQAETLEVLDFAEYLRTKQRCATGSVAVNAGLTYKEARQLALDLLQKPFAMGGQYERNRDTLHER